MECGGKRGKRSATPLWLVFLRYKTSLCHGVRRQAKRDAALACVSEVQNQPLPWSAAASEARRRFSSLPRFTCEFQQRDTIQSGVALRLPPHSIDISIRFVCNPDRTHLDPMHRCIV